MAFAIVAASCSDDGAPVVAPVTPPSLATPSTSGRPGDVRIVSLSPLATRFLVQLGLEDRLLSVGGAGGTGSASRSGAPPDRAMPGSDEMPTEPEESGELGAPAIDADLDAVARLDPDFVFLPALPDDRTALAPLEAAGARVVEFAPHDLEDLLALCHGVGVELAGASGVEAFERRVLRPVALVAGQSSPTDRLRAVALVGIDPPEIAGGHSFETDLIEVAGASSLTHGGEDTRRPIDREGLAAMKPDLVLVMTGTPPTPEQHERVLDLTYGIAPVHVFPFARETFWLDEPVRDATRLRALIVAAERERIAPAEP